jgi:hypothetical protein
MCCNESTGNNGGPSLGLGWEGWARKASPAAVPSRQPLQFGVPVAEKQGGWAPLDKALLRRQLCKRKWPRQRQSLGLMWGEFLWHSFVPGHLYIVEDGQDTGQLERENLCVCVSQVRGGPPVQHSPEVRPVTSRKKDSWEWGCAPKMSLAFHCHQELRGSRVWSLSTMSEESPSPGAVTGILASWEKEPFS